MNRWSLLTGKNDDILEIAALLGFKFRKDANGDFSHTNMITLLNEKGEIAFQLVGLNQGLKEFLKKYKRKEHEHETNRKHRTKNFI